MLASSLPPERCRQSQPLNLSILNEKLIVRTKGRLSRSSRSVFSRELESHFEVIAAQLTDEDETERRGRAMQIFGVMLRSLQLAGAIEDRDASDRMLEGGSEGRTKSGNALSTSALLS